MLSFETSTPNFSGEKHTYEEFILNTVHLIVLLGLAYTVNWAGLCAHKQIAGSVTQRSVDREQFFVVQESKYPKCDWSLSKTLRVTFERQHKRCAGIIVSSLTEGLSIP